MQKILISILVAILLTPQQSFAFNLSKIEGFRTMLKWSGNKKKCEAARKAVLAGCEAYHKKRGKLFEGYNYSKSYLACAKKANAFACGKRRFIRKPLKLPKFPPLVEPEEKPETVTTGASAEAPTEKMIDGGPTEKMIDGGPTEKMIDGGAEPPPAQEPRPSTPEEEEKAKRRKIIDREIGLVLQKLQKSGTWKECELALWHGITLCYYVRPPYHYSCLRKFYGVFRINKGACRPEGFPKAQPSAPAVLVAPVSRQPPPVPPQVDSFTALLLVMIVLLLLGDIGFRIYAFIKRKNAPSPEPVLPEEELQKSISALAKNIQDFRVGNENVLQFTGKRTEKIYAVANQLERSFATIMIMLGILGDSQVKDFVKKVLAQQKLELDRLKAKQKAAMAQGKKKPTLLQTQMENMGAILAEEEESAEEEKSAKESGLKSATTPASAHPPIPIVSVSPQPRPPVTPPAPNPATPQTPPVKSVIIANELGLGLEAGGIAEKFSLNLGEEETLERLPVHTLEPSPGEKVPPAISITPVSPVAAPPKNGLDFPKNAPPPPPPIPVPPANETGKFRIERVSSDALLPPAETSKKK